MTKQRYECEGESNCYNKVFLEKSESDKLFDSGKPLLCDSCKRKYGDMSFDELLELSEESE